ncbi:MAG: hypothetical protein JO353_07460, partial [Phycisphaerae bacterium]|nr:hypothetical protein [Phycisphaerae bacterium]
FSFDSKNNHHGSLDCFVFSTTPFQPHGVLKPDEKVPTAASDAGWFAFDPASDSFTDSPIDLRGMNEKAAGDGGFIGVKDGEFVHSASGKPIRFWGVNGPPADMSDPAALQRLARLLAKHGVNLIRIHGSVYDEAGNVDPKRIQRAWNIVGAMKSAGIYCHFSIYYFFWMHPQPNTPWLSGYDGKKPAPAAIFFNPDFQQHYLDWWKALLLTPDPSNGGKRLVDDPAVASVEMINEDSLLFWTFDKKNVPPAEWEKIESQFTQWAVHRYGSIDAAMKAWNGVGDQDDAPALGRLGIRPLWQITKEKTPRDQDTVRFLAETERSFYSKTIAALHEMGFKGTITASNWTTASPPLLDPLEKYVYTVGDFVDRHGYVDSGTSGDSADWSIRNDQTYLDRSALRFDGHEIGEPRILNEPVMDTHIDGKPSMLSEVAISRPNRYRSEAPLYFAAYGSLQASNSITHFALDGATWSVKPNYFMQPWTVMSPATMGQFPAAAIIYRERLVEPGAMTVNLSIRPDDLFKMSGNPASAVIAPLRETDPMEKVDPLACYVGRTSIHFNGGASTTHVQPLSDLANQQNRTVASSNHQLALDYEHGVLRIDTAKAQGLSGNLAAAGDVKLADITIHSPLDLAHVIAVALDDQPLAKSSHILLQVMSEERTSGFTTMTADNGRKRIVDIGHDPWLVKQLAGTVQFNRGDAGRLKVTALDGNGYPMSGKNPQTADHVTLEPDVIYYSISR